VEDERFPASGNAIRNAYSLNGPTQIGVRAGRHRFTAKLAGRTDAVWEVELSPKQQQSYTFKLAEPTAAPVAAAPASLVQPGGAAVSGDRVQSSSGMRIGSYVALGVGAVGIGVGTVFGLKAKGRYRDANAITDRECPGSGPCELEPSVNDQWRRLGNEGDSAKTLSLVGFIVGGVGVATGVTLFVLSGNKKEPAAAKVEPYLGLGALGVRGNF
jgi:hypothetical protein